jgi:Fasciclin domain
LVLHQFVRNVRACKNATNLIRGPVRMAAVMKTWGAAAGLLAGAVALGVAELTAAATGPVGAPVVAVGGTVTPAVMNGTYMVNKASVVCGNVQTANATVYIIDTVLMPPAH